MVLEPSLWGTLPKELLDLVFARLPIAGIGQLRVLSKEWKNNVDCKDSKFNQVLDATHLNMFALLPWKYIWRSGYIYDVQTHECHVYEVDFLQTSKIFNVADGGLVCFFTNYDSWYKDRGDCCVMNLLKKQKIKLPPLLIWNTEVYIGGDRQRVLIRMVKLTMSNETKNYQVFVLESTYMNGAKVLLAQVYDSHMKKWMVVEATHGRIIGWDYHWARCPWDVGFRYGLTVYNCANGTHQYFNKTDVAPRLDIKLGCCVLLEDHLFVLHKEASLDPEDLLEDSENVISKYCISEFHLPEKVTTWVKLRVHSCGPCKYFLETPPGIINLRLMGCNGFLLVYGIGCKLAWLYNLSTYKWHNLPTFESPVDPTMMCTLSWNAMF